MKENINFDGNGDVMPVSTIPDQIGQLVDRHLKFGVRSMKFDSLIGNPVGSGMFSDDQIEIARRFAHLVPRAKPGWHCAMISFHTTEGGEVDLIDQTRVVSTGTEVFRMRVEPK